MMQTCPMMCLRPLDVQKYYEIPQLWLVLIIKRMARRFIAVTPWAEGKNLYLEAMKHLMITDPCGFEQMILQTRDLLKEEVKRP